MQQGQVRVPHCAGLLPKGEKCEEPLPSSVPRVFKGRQWFCLDCVYRQEVNPDPELVRPKPRRSKRPQKETLFDGAPEPDDDMSFGEWVERGCP